MSEKIRRCLAGYLKVRLSGNQAERFMNLCSYREINLWDVKLVEESYEMKVALRDFWKIKPIIRKTGTKVKVVERYGFPFFWKKYKTRYFLIAGALGAACFLLFMTTYIWRIEINGNVSCSDEEIKSYLKSIAVFEGQSKKRISCNFVADQLREQFEEMIWVSVSIDGVDVIVEIKENTDFISEEKGEGPSNLIANREGIITSIITSHGVPKVKVGDAVEKGDVLVSGIVEVRNDAMEVVGYQYCEAEAEIYAQTELFYIDSIESVCQILKETGKTSYQFWVEGEEVIRVLGNPEYTYKYYKTLTEQENLKLLNVFPIPWKFGICRVVECEKKEKVYTPEEMRQILSENFHRFCQDLGKKGVQILKNDVTIYRGVECTSAKGLLTLEEKIGESEAAEKIDFISKEEGNI